MKLTSNEFLISVFIILIEYQIDAVTLMKIVNITFDNCIYSVHLGDCQFPYQMHMTWSVLTLIEFELKKFLYMLLI